MMQSFSKMELAWIYKALEKQVMESLHVMRESENGSPLFHLAELNRDNLRSTMHKIHEAMNGDCKRIAIK